MKRKRLGLIAMSGVRVRTARLAWLGVTLPQFVSRGHVVASLPSLSLLTLAALTPADIEVEYLEVPDFHDLKLESLPQFDAVAISSYSAQINEAYQFADVIRARGTRVIMGGPHVSALPDEALCHCDCVVLGEGEPLWPEVMQDWLGGSLRSLYREAQPGRYDLARSPVPRFDLLDPENYNRIPLQTSRGCPRDCTFCAGSKRFGPGFRQKPVRKVMAEIESLQSKWTRPFIELADDNTFVNKKWSEELLAAINPLKLRWFAETDISIAEHDRLLRNLRSAGCYQLLIGLESLDSAVLQGAEKTGWKAHQMKGYAEAVRKIQEHGITVNTCFVVGFDNDTPRVFDLIRDFDDKVRPLDIQVTVLTPFPGTELFEELKRGGRLDPTPFWDRLTLFDLNYTPLSMTREELEDGLFDLFQDLYNEDKFNLRKRRYMDIVKSVGGR